MIQFGHPFSSYLTAVYLKKKGIHAREWIAPAYVTWMIRELVENYAAHPEYVDNIDWFVSNHIESIW